MTRGTIESLALIAADAHEVYDDFVAGGCKDTGVKAVFENMLDSYLLRADYAGITDVTAGAMDLAARHAATRRATCAKWDRLRRQARFEEQSAFTMPVEQIGKYERTAPEYGW